MCHLDSLTAETGLILIFLWDCHMINPLSYIYIIYIVENNWYTFKIYILYLYSIGLNLLKKHLFI